MSNIYLENHFYKIVEKVVLYLNTNYFDDIKYHNECINPAFNYEYIIDKIDYFEDGVLNMQYDCYKTYMPDIISIIDVGFPDRICDENYDDMVEAVVDWFKCSQDHYFEDYEVDEEDTRTINYDFRYIMNVINYLYLFVNGNERDNVKEYIETILEELLIADMNCLK